MRSTTHQRGRTSCKPLLGAINLCSSTFLSSLAHSSCAQRSAPSARGAAWAASYALPRRLDPYPPVPTTTSSSFAPAASLSGVYLRQVREALKATARKFQQQPAAGIFVGDLGAVNLGFEYQTFRVNEQQVALAISSFLCTPSYPRCCSPPTPVVLADWKFTIPDTRMNLPPQPLPQPFPQTLAQRRIHLSHVPSIRHLPKPALDGFSGTGTRGAPSSVDNRS